MNLFNCLAVSCMSIHPLKIPEGFFFNPDAIRFLKIADKFGFFLWMSDWGRVLTSWLVTSFLT